MRISRADGVATLFLCLAVRHSSSLCMGHETCFSLSVRSSVFVHPKEDISLRMSIRKPKETQDLNKINRNVGGNKKKNVIKKYTEEERLVCRGEPQSQQRLGREK